MAKSLFQRNPPEDRPSTPYELIEPEIVHLKKGTSVRHGPRAQRKSSPWLIILGFCGLVLLYVLDPFLHAWYKGEAVRTYLYLHNYGAGPLADNLVATHILSEDEVNVLNHRQGSFQDYYASPDAANQEAQTIIDYVNGVKLLHAGKYQHLNPVGRLRYLIFIRMGLNPPTDWTSLDPSVSD